MEFIELYRDGNIRDDIEPDDKIIHSVIKSTVTTMYEMGSSQVKLTDDMDELRFFIREPNFDLPKMPWD